MKSEGDGVWEGEHGRSRQAQRESLCLRVCPEMSSVQVGGELPNSRGWTAEAHPGSKECGLFLHLILSESFPVGKTAVDSAWQMRELRCTKAEPYLWL